MSSLNWGDTARFRAPWIRGRLYRSRTRHPADDAANGRDAAEFPPDRSKFSAVANYMGRLGGASYLMDLVDCVGYPGNPAKYRRCARPPPDRFFGEGAGLI